MATEQEIRDLVLSRMLAGYAQPKHVSDPTVKMGDYLAALATFDPTILQAGWAHVVSHHRFTIWPEPAAIANACRQVLDDQAKAAASARAAAGQSEAAASAKATSAAEQAADGAMHSALGIEARRDGWSRSLWQAVVQAGALSAVPPERLDRMRAAAAKARDQIAQWEAPADPAAPASASGLARNLYSIAKKMRQAERDHAARFETAQPSERTA